MKAIILAALLVLFPGLGWAEEDPVVAIWSEDSGSLPPEYAWEYWVRIRGSGLIEVEYCKGYAESAPGCATVSKQLSDEDLDAMEAEVEPFAADLVARPPLRASDDEIPIGGGSIGGWIILGETKVTLFAYPAQADAERVKSVLAILQKYTPTKLIKRAERRARQP